MKRQKRNIKVQKRKKLKNIRMDDYDPYKILEPISIHKKLLKFYVVGIGNSIAWFLLLLTINFLDSEVGTVGFRFIANLLKVSISFTVILILRALQSSLKSELSNAYKNLKVSKNQKEFHRGVLELDGISIKKKLINTRFTTMASLIFVIYIICVVIEVVEDPNGVLGVLVTLSTSILGGLVLEQIVERLFILPHEFRENYKERVVVSIE